MTFNGRPTLRIPSGSGHCQMAGFSVNKQLYSSSRIWPPLNLETLLGIGWDCLFFRWQYMENHSSFFSFLNPHGGQVHHPCADELSVMQWNMAQFGIREQKLPLIWHFVRGVLFQSDIHRSITEVAAINYSNKCLTHHALWLQVDLVTFLNQGGD